MKQLTKGHIAFATGVYLEWNGDWWNVPRLSADFPFGTPFQDDTYHEGNLVNNTEQKPFIEGDNHVSNRTGT